MDDGNDGITNEPWPHGELFGGVVLVQRPVVSGKGGDYELRAWYGKYQRIPAGWKMDWVDEAEVPQFSAIGATEKEAFENLAAYHTRLNGGVMSEVLQRLMPFLLSHFDSEGHAIDLATDDYEVIKNESDGKWLLA